MKPTARILIAEFLVQVYPNKIEWDGLDEFLWQLLHAKPQSGFLSLLKRKKRKQGVSS